MRPLRYRACEASTHVSHSLHDLHSRRHPRPLPCTPLNESGVLSFQCVASHKHFLPLPANSQVRHDCVHINDCTMMHALKLAHKTLLRLTFCHRSGACARHDSSFAASPNHSLPLFLHLCTSSSLRAFPFCTRSSLRSRRCLHSHLTPACLHSLPPQNRHNTPLLPDSNAAEVHIPISSVPTLNSSNIPFHVSPRVILHVIVTFLQFYNFACLCA
jgi:hypothetical protein